jgi:hypothetical protein
MTRRCLALLLLASVDCHSGDASTEPEPTATAVAPQPPTLTTSVASAIPAPDDAAPAPSPWPVTHTIVEADHLHKVDLRVGDSLEVPAEDSFVWTVASNEIQLQPMKVDAGARARFKATKIGSGRFVVHGDPKCRANDASCGTSVREWTVFVLVH